MKTFMLLILHETFMLLILHEVEILENIEDVWTCTYIIVSSTTYWYVTGPEWVNLNEKFSRADDTLIFKCEFLFQWRFYFVSKTILRFVLYSQMVFPTHKWCSLFMNGVPYSWIVFFIHKWCSLFMNDVLYSQMVFPTHKWCSLLINSA